MAMAVFNALEDYPRKKGRSVNFSMLAGEYESFRESLDAPSHLPGFMSAGLCSSKTQHSCKPIVDALFF